MKKSKVIIPALGVLVLSTAASVTGTVAWFTANRTATITAGEFAVVNTNSNLEVVLSNGIGVTPAGDNKSVTTKTDYTLTDSSLDHTAVAHNVVVPDASRTTTESLVSHTNYSEGNFLRATNVYSAFAWDITFSITFPGAAVYNMGIFLDLSESYVHEVSHFADGHRFTSADAGTYFTNAKCTEGSVTKAANDVQSGAATLYKQVPDATGKGFRMAFLPKTVTGANDIAYAKVWAPNQASANTTFVSNPTLDAVLPAGTAYGTSTTKMTNGTGSTETLGASKVVICNNLNNSDPIPGEHTQSHSTSLTSNANYLAYIKLNAGATSSVTFTCLCWYEGTDPEIVAGATNFEQVVCGMKFCAVELTA